MGFPENRALIEGKPALPGNSQHTLLFDTTRGCLNRDSSFVATAAAPVPGTEKGGGYRGKTVTCWVKPTGQSITAVFEALTDPDGTTAAAFEQDVDAPGGGSVVVAAGDAQPFEWTPKYAHYRCRLVAGGTAPSDLDGEAWIRDP
jgi:hypothetical protein